MDVVLSDRKTCRIDEGTEPEKEKQEVYGVWKTLNFQHWSM